MNFIGNMLFYENGGTPICHYIKNKDSLSWFIGIIDDTNKLHFFVNHYDNLNYYKVMYL